MSCHDPKTLMTNCNKFFYSWPCQSFKVIKTLNVFQHKHNENRDF